MKYFTVLVLLILTSAALHSQQKKSEQVPYFSLSPTAGIVLPSDDFLKDNFEQGWTAGLKLNYRFRNNFGIFSNFLYHNLNSKTTDENAGQYIEVSAGPGYFFTKPDSRIQLNAEAGVGTYNFAKQNSDDPGIIQPDLSSIAGIKAGVNAGIGAGILLSKRTGINVNGKYHSIFNSEGNTNFITVSGGIEFRFK